MTRAPAIGLGHPAQERVHRRRILHLARPGSVVPDAAVADLDRVVYIGTIDSATLCDLIFQAERVVVW